MNNEVCYNLKMIKISHVTEIDYICGRLFGHVAWKSLEEIVVINGFWKVILMTVIIL